MNAVDPSVGALRATDSREDAGYHENECPF